MTLTHISYRPDTDLLAVAQLVARGELQVLERPEGEEFLLFVTLHNFRDDMSFHARTLRPQGATSENAQLYDRLWKGPLANDSNDLPMTLLLVEHLAPLAVLRGRGDPEHFARTFIGDERSPREAHDPRSVLDSLRGAPILEEGDLDFARQDEDRLPDFTEDT